MLRQMNGDVDAIVVGVGSGGTLTGVGRFMKAHSPKTKMVLADPVGSVLAPLIKTGKMTEAGSWAVEGIGEDFVPKNCDLSLVRAAYAIEDRESFAAARDLLRREGVFGGSSTGTLLAAALRYCREQTEPQRVVSLVPDSGAKYLSKVYNDAFLAQEGWSGRESAGTVRDVVINRYPEGGIVSVTPNDTLQDAVLVRSDGVPLYNFGAVVDDITMGITLVARGRDHMINTPPQILLYEALGAKIPTFAHLPMMLCQDGKKLSKRNGSVAVGASCEGPANRFDVVGARKTFETVPRNSRSSIGRYSIAIFQLLVLPKLEYFE